MENTTEYEVMQTNDNVVDNSISENVISEVKDSIGTITIIRPTFSEERFNRICEECILLQYSWLND